MLTIRPDTTFDWPVVVPTPENGPGTTGTFNATFKIVDHSFEMEHQNNLKLLFQEALVSHDAQVLDRDGVEVTDLQERKSSLLSQRRVLTALLQSYVEGQEMAQEKN